MSANAFIKNLRKKIGSSSFKESRFGTISHYINTGNYVLNKIFSGDFNGGIPSGRITMFSGESSVGKSFIGANIASNALNLSDYDQIIYFDSEGGADKEFWENLSCDSDLVEQVLVESVEDATIKMRNVLKELEFYKFGKKEGKKEIKAEDPDFKCLLILDSLGQLVDGKAISDIDDKNKTVADMGTFAKQCKKLFKMLTVPALKADTPVLILNHIYCDPNAMYPSAIKNQSGGEASKYSPSLSIQGARKLDKNLEDKDEVYKGATLVFFTVKNRIIRPFQKAEVYLDFRKGLDKYSGLFEFALKYEIIQSPKKGWYIIPSIDSNKSYRKSEIENDKEIFEKIFDELDKVSAVDLKYAKKETEQVEKEIEEITNNG